MAASQVIFLCKGDKFAGWFPAQFIWSWRYCKKSSFISDSHTLCLQQIACGSLWAQSLKLKDGRGRPTPKHSPSCLRQVSKLTIFWIGPGPQEAVGHPFLKTFKAWLDRAMGNLIQVQGWIQPWSLSYFKWVFTPDDLQKSLPAPIILWFITSWHAQNCGRVCVCAQCIWWNKVIVHLFNFFSYLIHCIWLHSNFSFIFETYGWNGALCLLKPVPAAATCIQPCPGIPSINLLMWWLAMFENNVFVYLNTGSDAYVQS